MPLEIRMTFALPERVQPQRDAEGAERRDEWGKLKTERCPMVAVNPGDPVTTIRPARATDCNCWWEPLTADKPDGLTLDAMLGATIREV